MGFPWSETINVVIATFSAAAAGGSWKAARRANDAAKRSNDTAEAVARIERERWHADLTPQFDITLTETGSGDARLNVHLDGPDHLRHLDAVTITVGDDDNDHTLYQPRVGLTQADYDAQIFGPYRFLPTSDGADQDGRAVAPTPLTVGRGRPFSMERTEPGHWMAMDMTAWQRQNADKPIRLTLTCRRGDEEWVIARRIDNPPWTPPT
jgi:hypothetical protein